MTVSSTRYKMSDKSYDSAKDFNTLSGAGNTFPQGIWSNGSTMWVLDAADDDMFAYNLSSKAREQSNEFNREADNASPRGMWGNSATIWVSDDIDNKLYAYKLNPGGSDHGDRGHQ